MWLSLPRGVGRMWEKLDNYMREKRIERDDDGDEMDRVGSRWGLMWKIGLVSAGGAVLIVSTTVICLIIKALRKNKKPVPNGTNQDGKANPEEQSEIMSMKPKPKKSKYVEMIPTLPKMSQNKDVRNLEIKSNHGVSPKPGDDLYENCDFVEGALYANI
ncbi:hypothetical protein scyTo_0020535 [Scyliorhinus torazame]|uniref:Uncharacterized protein n=1 Tax=Scyliorhinus torazame TaxID=75743 RepID=A0A401PVB1_SCYTO|nr:hypothetical protein [Scyliorhinus torazame]